MSSQLMRSDCRTMSPGGTGDGTAAMRPAALPPAALKACQGGFLKGVPHVLMFRIAQRPQLELPHCSAFKLALARACKQ